jgi:Putative peptidoglycan binding domain
MRFKVISSVLAGALLLSAPAAATTSTKKKPTLKKTTSASHSHKKSKKTSKARNPPRKRGQQAIDSQRTTEIQQALVQSGYLKSDHVSGKLDDTTKLALTKMQADHGWQTKIVPDSRALIQLGLGPDQSAIINKNTAVLSSIPKTAAEVPDK